MTNIWTQPRKMPPELGTWQGRLAGVIAAWRQKQSLFVRLV